MSQPAPPPIGSTVIFQQPQESGIAGHFYVPNAPSRIAPPDGVFNLILWQVDPFTANGLLVPTTWDAGSMTGFTPTSPATAQLGFQNVAGTSTGQMEGGTVGAYINSQDLPNSPPGQKMMITPELDFASGAQSVPFATTSSSMGSSLNLQIPVAAGNDTYVNADFLFLGPNGVRFSVNVKLFGNGVLNPQLSTAYDEPSNSYNFAPPLLGSYQQYLTIASGSSETQGEPWLGWRSFAWSMTQAQFASVLNYMAAQYPGVFTSLEPSEYALIEVHLNAEFHFQPNSAELGWSMYGWTVWVSGSGSNSSG